MEPLHPALRPAVAVAVTEAQALTVGPQQQRPGDPEPVPTEIGTLYYWLVDKVFQPLKQQEAAMSAVPALLSDMAQQLLGTMGDITARMGQQFTQLLTQQAQVQATALAQARLDIHAEILGSAAPLLAMIEQIKALDLSDEAADTAIHNQLLAALGQQATQLQTTVGRLDTTSATVASQQNMLAEMLTVNLGQTQDIAAVRLAQTALRTELTTTTSTANSAQALATSQTPLISALQTDVGTRLLATSFKGLRVPTPAMAISATATIAVTWPVPFADDKYTVVALPETSALLGSFTLISHTKEGCVVSVKNSGLVALLAGAATLHLLAKKD